MKQTKTVPAAVYFGLTDEGQVPNSGVDPGPLAVGLGCCLLPEASVVSQPRTALIPITGLQHENLVAHQTRYMLRLFSGDDGHMYSKGLEPFSNTGDWALLRLRSCCSSKPKWLSTRSPNSMNAQASIFCTRLGGTGGIVEPGRGGTGGIVEPGGSGMVALLWVVASTLTWLRSRPAGVMGGGRRLHNTFDILW